MTHSARSSIGQSRRVLIGGVAGSIPAGRTIQPDRGLKPGCKLVEQRAAIGIDRNHQQPRRGHFAASPPRDGVT